MRLLYYCMLFVVFAACQKETTSNSNTTAEAAKTVSTAAEKPTLTGEKQCFKRPSELGGMEFEFVVDDDKAVEGFLSIKSRTEDINGPVKGKYYTDEYILDFTYTVDGKPCMEKLLLNYNNRDAIVSRSGSIMIDGERRERNGGQGTMDYIPRVHCD